MYTRRPHRGTGMAAVFHAGGVLADALIANQSLSGIREAAAAKGVAVVKSSKWTCAHPLTTQVGMLECH